MLPKPSWLTAMSTHIHARMRSRAGSRMTARMYHVSRPAANETLGNEGAHMENPHATSLSLLDEVKLQARVLVPVIRALRERIGKAVADELVGTALRQWSRDLH